MVRLLVLLLAIPSLLMPPGMCVCRLVPSLVGRPATERSVPVAAASIKPGTCTKDCCDRSQTVTSEHTLEASLAGHDLTQPSAPERPEPPCSFSALTTYYPLAVEPVSVLLDLAAFISVSFLPVERPVRPVGGVLSGDLLTAAQPAYITFCTLLI